MKNCQSDARGIDVAAEMQDSDTRMHVTILEKMLEFDHLALL